MAVVSLSLLLAATVAGQEATPPILDLVVIGGPALLQNWEAPRAYSQETGFDLEGLRRQYGDRLFGAWRLAESGAALLVSADAPPLPELREEQRLFAALTANGGIVTPELLGPRATRVGLQIAERDPEAFPPVFQLDQVLEVSTPQGRVNLFFRPDSENLARRRGLSPTGRADWERIAAQDQSDLKSATGPGPANSLVMRFDTAGNQTDLGAEAMRFFQQLVAKESQARQARWQVLMRTLDPSGAFYQSLPNRGGLSELPREVQDKVRQKLISQGGVEEAQLDQVFRTATFRIRYGAAYILPGANSLGRWELFWMSP
ncbi:MAG: hypothetical protein MH204_06915 [Fimbriimonadaceae bacterium]|nr:hypothetical protein [Fimbriimonadaceae bacterium]